MNKKGPVSKQKKNTARSVSARNPMHLTCECNLLLQTPRKDSAYKNMFCISVCVSFGPNQKQIQRRCLSFSTMVHLFSVVFLYGLVRTFTILQQKSSLCCISVFKMQYLTFLSVLLIPLWVFRVLVYSFYSMEDLRTGMSSRKGSSEERAFQLQ